MLNFACERARLVFTFHKTVSMHCDAQDILSHGDFCLSFALQHNGKISNIRSRSHGPMYVNFTLVAHGESTCTFFNLNIDERENWFQFYKSVKSVAKFLERVFSCFAFLYALCLRKNDVGLFFCVSESVWWEKGMSECEPRAERLCFQSLFQQERGSDVVFEVGPPESQTWRLTAHRNVLAACSPVLGAMMYGPLAHKKGATIEIRDIEPRAFNCLLR